MKHLAASSTISDVWSKEPSKNRRNPSWFQFNYHAEPLKANLMVIDCDQCATRGSGDTALFSRSSVSPVTLYLATRCLCTTVFYLLEFLKPKIKGKTNNGANILVNNYIEYYHFALYYITVIISEFYCQTIITAVMEPQLRL